MSPRVQFANTTYEFGKVMAGEVVRHEFVFTNTGDAALEVTAVRPRCGCTTAGEATKLVEPGKTGTIPLQFNSVNFNGPVDKMADVDFKGMPSVLLHLKGAVWKPIEITPTLAILSTVAGAMTNATSIVRIINHQDQPVTLSDLTSSNPSFTAELKTVEPGKEFQVIIKTVPPLGPKNVVGQITMKTSSTNMPSITFTAFATVRAPPKPPATSGVQTN